MTNSMNIIKSRKIYIYKFITNCNTLFSIFLAVYSDDLYNINLKAYMRTINYFLSWHYIVLRYNNSVNQITLTQHPLTWLCVVLVLYFYSCLINQWQFCVPFHLEWPDFNKALYNQYFISTMQYFRMHKSWNLTYEHMHWW